MITLLLTYSYANANDTLVIGSKRFSENFVLAEIFSQLLESEGYKVDRRFGMGGTMAAYYALKEHELDIYPEYSGTIAQTVLKSDIKDYQNINKALEPLEVRMLKPLGLNNSYCLIVRRDFAEQHNIKSISDLAKHQQLKGAVSFEFQKRKDGWPGLKKTYGLKNSLVNMDVPLNYEALRNKKVDFAEAYTTEPLIDKFDFLILKDNKHFFPIYLASAFVHHQVPLAVRNVLNRLSGLIDDDKIRQLTARVNRGEKIPVVAQDFLANENLISEDQKQVTTEGIPWKQILKHTKTHLFLTLFAVVLATLVAVPLASLISGSPLASRYVLGFTGILQTIPSIALLTFMIPFFGIGLKPAIVGLFIYSLLPIVRNTHTAMVGIDPRLITSAKGIGLYPTEIFLSVKLPLAFPTILAGIRTATTLNIGTATLAAFIGAGGLGAPIVSGLALNDSRIVLQGAIPAALLAIVIDFTFGLIEKHFTKKI